MTHLGTTLYYIQLNIVSKVETKQEGSLTYASFVTTVYAILSIEYCF